MAEFTRKDDTGVHFLTRLVQLDAGDAGEVLRFLWRAHRESYKLPDVAPDQVPEFVERFGTLGRFTNVDDVMPAIAKVQEIAALAMGGAADCNNQGFPEGACNLFAMLAWQYLRAGLMFTNDQAVPLPSFEVARALDNGERIIPRQAIKKYTQVDRPLGLAQSWDELYSLFTEISVECRRCAECGFPYIVGRQDQEFCSNRCRTRQSVRRQWRKKHPKSV